MYRTRREMTIEIRARAKDFVNTSFPEALGAIDLDRSCRNFERMLESELIRIYPSAEITVHVADTPETIIYLDDEDVATSDNPEASGVHISVRYAMDKLFFYGRFWEDARLSKDSSPSA